MKDALNLLYTDRMDVQRQERYQTEYGETKERLKAGYENAPCRISFTSAFTISSMPERTDRLPGIEYKAMVFYDKEYVLLQNDLVTIKRGDRVYQGKAGLSAAYPRHVQTPIAIFER